MNPCRNCPRRLDCPHSQDRISDLALERAARQGREAVRLLRSPGADSEQALREALRAELALLATL